MRALARLAWLALTLSVACGYGFGATFFVTEFPQPPFSDTTLYTTWPQMGDLNR